MMRISNEAKQIILMVFALSLIFFGIGFILTEDSKSVFLGLLLGAGFTILKVILIEKTLSKAIKMPPEKAIGYTRFHYVIRYILTGFVLLIACLREDVNLYATIMGLIVLSPAVYFIKLKEKILKK